MMEERNATNTVTQPDDGDRRRYERWEPSDVTLALVTSPTHDWVGGIANLSEGGVEVLGVPVERLGGPVIVEIRFGSWAVMRTGVLKRIRLAPRRDTHVIVFDDCSEALENAQECICCGAVLVPDDDDLTETECTGGICLSCADRASESLGTDFEYDELGWGG